MKHTYTITAWLAVCTLLALTGCGGEKASAESEDNALVIFNYGDYIDTRIPGRPIQRLCVGRHSKNPGRVNRRRSY